MKELKSEVGPIFAVTMVMSTVEVIILVAAMVLAQQEDSDSALCVWAVLPVFVFGLRLFGGYKHRPNQSKESDVRMKFLDKHHMAERYGLLVLITIGEIVSAAASADDFGDNGEGE